MRTKGRSGKLKKSITVESNDPANPKLKLAIQGEVTVDVEVTPRNLTFGQVAKNETMTKTFNIKVTEPDKVKIVSVKLEDEKFELTHKSGDPAGDSEYEVKFKGATELDRISSRITITFDGSDTKSIEVPVRVNVVGNLRYSKDIYFFKRGDAYEPREITLNTRSGKPVKILGVSDPDNLLKTKIVEAEGQTVKIMAEIADPAQKFDPPQKHQLVIKTNDKDEPEVKIGYSVSTRARADRGGRGMAKPFLKGADIGMLQPGSAETKEEKR